MKIKNNIRLLGIGLVGTIAVFLVMNTLFHEDTIDLVPCEDCNVILISLDACRPDHMSVYGYHRNTTPFLQSLNNTIVFDRVIAPTFYTPTSHATMLTGLEPFEHGVLDFGMDLNENLNTIAEYFTNKDYSTKGIVNTESISSEYGFDQGFDRFYYIEEQNASIVTNKMIENIPGEEKFFIFAHYFQLHSPYKTISNKPKFVNSSYNGILRKKDIIATEQLGVQEKNFINDNYDDDMLYLDGQIRLIVDSLKKKGIYNKTLLLITSDHGEALGEHFKDRIFVGHTFLSYPTIHVPLVIIHPKSNKKSIKKVTGLIHLPNIIKYLLGFDNDLNFEEGIFSYIPLLENNYRFLSHRIGRFEILEDKDVNFLFFYNIGNNRFSELSQDISSELERYISIDIAKEFNCNKNNFSVISGGLFLDASLHNKSKEFLQKINCTFINNLDEKKEFSSEKGIRFYPQFCHFVYSYTTEKREYLMDCEGNMYYFDEASWKSMQTDFLPTNVIENIYFYSKTKELIEMTPPCSLISTC